MNVPVSIYARFGTEKDRKDWFDSHILPETVTNGGPVFSWSIEDESGYRDLITELVGALEDCTEHLEHSTSHGKTAWDKAKSLIAKAKGSEQ